MTASVWQSKCPCGCTKPCPHHNADITVKYDKPPPEMIDGPAIDFSAPSPSVGHVCEGSPTGRKPSLCWICGQFLPHDCVGSAQPSANSLDGFPLLPDAQTTHGPPQKVELSTPIPGACILLHPEPADDDALCGCSLPPHTIAQCVVRGAKRLTVAGRKWPIGTPTEKLGSTWGHRLGLARCERHLSGEAVGALLNPPRTRKDISAMEHGRRGLSVELCAQLADALDCDRLWLAGWTLEGAP